MSLEFILNAAKHTCCAHVHKVVMVLSVKTLNVVKMQIVLNKFSHTTNSQCKQQHVNC